MAVKESKRKRTLNPRQKLFVKHYAKTRNGTKAAKAAGYSKRSASTTASELLTYPKVSEGINRELERRTVKFDLSADEVLEEIRALAFVNLRGAFAEDGSLLPLQEMPENVSKALQSVETDELFAGRGVSRVKIGRTRKVKIADKIRALELLAKHFKLLSDTAPKDTSPETAPQVVLTLPSNGSEISVSVQVQQPPNQESPATNEACNESSPDAGPPAPGDPSNTS